MDGRLTLLESLHVQTPFGNVDLFPAQRDRLRNTQAMSVTHQDQRGVAMTMASDLPSRAHQSLDFIFRQVFARTDLAVLPLAR
jgi:hypothetical protein